MRGAPIREMRASVGRSMVPVLCVCSCTQGHVCIAHQENGMNWDAHHDLRDYTVGSSDAD